jgi:beta-lactamase class A
MRSSPTPRRGGFPVLEVAGLLLILASTLLLMRELSRFSEERQQMSQGLVLGDVPVSGLDRAEAQAYVERVYGAPVSVMLQGQEIRLNPEEVGFKVDSEAMLSRAGTDETFWSGFWDYLWRRPEQPKQIDLIASYSDELLKAWVADVAARYDAPATSAASRLDTLSFNEGQAGFVLDQEGAVEALDAALMRPVNRTVAFSIKQTDVERPGMDTLSDLLVDYLEGQKFRGVASIYLVDEVTGDQMSLDVDLREGTPEMVDCDIPYAGLSTMKIPLTEEFFRWLVDIYPYEFDMIEATLTESSNLNANFMLRDIGGGDMLAGTQVVNASMQHLGLENTFLVAPYDDEDPPEYYSTPAREAVRNGECINTNPDPYMQTTAEDLSILLDMVYQCMAFDGGGLIAAYGDALTQNECEMMLDVMQQNDEGKLILAGVPEDVEVAHKHGYTYDTISDAGVVLSPSGDYVLVIFLWQDVSWIAGTAFPLMEGISTAVFNYFNPDMINVPRQGYGDVLTPVETATPDTQ